jgi:hypothetical protein
MDQESREESYTVAGNDEQLGKLLPALAGMVCHSEILRFDLIMTGQRLTLHIVFDKPDKGGRSAEIDREISILRKLKETGCSIN